MDAGQTKRRRVTRACDRCHRSGIKCAPSTTPDKCSACASFGSDCTYDRPIKRRGPPPRAGPYTSRQGHQRHVSRMSGTLDDDGWEYEEVADAVTIEELADAFYRICYPILHPFHWPSFMQAIREQKYRTCRSFYVTTMAVCALASARLRDGAVNPAQSPRSLRVDGDSPATPVPGPSTASLPAGTSNASPAARPSTTSPPSETFYRASLRAFPTDLARAPDFDYKRAKTVLSVTAIQYGAVRDAQCHLGDCITLCAMDGFNNEARWPAGLNEIEIQERRRLFWLTYHHDVYTATTWNGIVKHRESQSTVLYPAEVDDDEITADGLVLRPGPRIRFFRGWNLVTDMYRIMEHALEQLRSKRSESAVYGSASNGAGPNDRKAPVTDLYAARVWPSAQQVLDVVGRLYDTLPPDFKRVRAMTGDFQQDVIGFQGVNIIITLQTMKMVLAGLDEASSVEKRCAIAGELLDAFAAIPTAFMHTVSSPLLHHLAGVGHLLGSVIQSPLSPWSYLQVRHVLLAMADLLSSLEAVLTNVPGISDKLRAHVSRIDQYMSAAAAERTRSGHAWGFLPPVAGGADMKPSTSGHSHAVDATKGKRTGANKLKHEITTNGDDHPPGLGAYAPSTSAVRDQSRSAAVANAPTIPLSFNQKTRAVNGVDFTGAGAHRRLLPEAQAAPLDVSGLSAPAAKPTSRRSHAHTTVSSSGGSGNLVAGSSGSSSSLSLDELVAAAAAAGPPTLQSGRDVTPYDLSLATSCSLEGLPALSSITSLPSFQSDPDSFSSNQTLGSLPSLMSASTIPPTAANQAYASAVGTVADHSAAWSYPPIPSVAPSAPPLAGSGQPRGAAGLVDALPSDVNVPGPEGGQHDAITLPNDLWLPSDLWVDWPFEQSHGDAFDFLGEWAEHAAETG
ncbi:hypothetical protein Q5752_001295 [Cryptotrichosporon argae]